MLIQGRTVIAFELMLSMAVMDELGQDLLCCLFSIDFVQDNEIWMIKTSTLKEDCFTFNHNWSDKRSFVFKVITDMWIDSSHPDIYFVHAMNSSLQSSKIHINTKCVFVCGCLDSSVGNNVLEEVNGKSLQLSIIELFSG